MTRFWRDAATMLLIRRSDSARHHSKIKNFNYKVLMLERSSKSSFMPSAYVFPGGKLGNGDLNTSWNEIFHSSSMYKSLKDQNNYGLPCMDSQKQRSPALTVQDAYLSRDVAFRICAIRETFEEAGILIGQSSEGNNMQINESTLKEWRDEINKDDSRFIEMCRAVNVTPDIWNLYEYCNWLTPTDLAEIDGKRRRFDTIFYMTFLEQTLEAAHDEQEIVSSKWYHPYDLIEEHYSKKIWLAPPQLYELLRLFCEGMGDYDTLRSFVQRRSTKGIVRWLPVRFNCEDGILSVLPGDELFPDNLDEEGCDTAPELSMSIEEARRKTSRHNRIEIKGLHSMNIVCNIDTGNGHTSPVYWPLSKEMS